MIKNINLIIVLVIIFFVSSCNINNDLRKKVFDIDYGENYDTISIVKNYKFNKILTDISIFEKKETDTITAITFKNSTNKIYYISWQIKFKSNDVEEVMKFLQEQQLLLLSPICFNNKSDKSDGGFFSVIRAKDNNVFNCTLFKDKEENILLLNAFYYKPFK